MFKSIVYKGIKGLGKLYKFLDEVYEEAYSKLEREFEKKVQVIKEKNKRDFIKKVSALVSIKCLNETGLQMPEHMAEEFAHQMFKEAKSCGDLDILNRFKGKD